jgi:hypothetical protein
MTKCTQENLPSEVPIPFNQRSAHPTNDPDQSTRVRDSLKNQASGPPSQIPRFSARSTRIINAKNGRYRSREPNKLDHCNVQ